MKKSGLFLTSIFLVTTFLSFQPADAQEKSNADVEKDKKIQKEIEIQKKAVVEAKKAQEEAMQKLELDQDSLENTLKDLNIQVEVNDLNKANEDFAHVNRINRSFHFKTPYVVSPDAWSEHFFDGDNESTNWEFSRSVKEKSIKSEYTIDVEKNSNTVVMSVNGDCKAGDIRIKIITPGGKTYSDVVIDEFGNLNWRKSFTISDSENQDKAGPWKFQINSNKATGYFKISLQAY